jgi:hypothetical protein
MPELKLETMTLVTHWKGRVLVQAEGKPAEDAAGDLRPALGEGAAVARGCLGHERHEQDPISGRRAELCRHVVGEVVEDVFEAAE